MERGHNKKGYLMPGKTLKNKFGDFLILLADWLEPKKQNKKLTPQIFQQEMGEFVKTHTVDVNDIGKLQAQIKQYFADKGYSLDGHDLDVRPMEQMKNIKLPSNITKITEDLNDYTKGINIFTDTTEMIPGLVCYTIEKIEPTDKIPYVRYRPVARVITQVHDSGVNGGTIFFSYNHNFVKSMDFNGWKTGKVFAEESVIYSPLTEQQANYICKLLNIQSRMFYHNQMKKLKTAQNVSQRTK